MSNEAGYVWGGECVAMEKFVEAAVAIQKNWGSILASYWVNWDVMLGISEPLARNVVVLGK